MFENVSVIGGDLRQLTVAKLLKAEGYHVFLYGFDKDIQLETLECETDKDLVLSADIVILPVPVYNLICKKHSKITISHIATTLNAKNFQ